MRNKILLLTLLFSLPLLAKEKAQGFCEQGGETVTVNATVNSTSRVQKSYRGCTITVYAAGTVNVVDIFSDNNTVPTPKANPFTADGTTGAWFFYAANGRYDVRLSGAGLTPYTRGNVTLFDSRDFYISITDFGAVGDSVTDDTVAIQAALDFAAQQHKTLIIPGTPDCYKTTDTLNIPGGTTFTGWSDNSASPLICYGGADTSKDIINVGNAGTGAVVFRVYLHGFSIDSTTGAANGVHLHRASEGIIDIQIGNSAHPRVIDTGLYCDQCFIWEFKPVIIYVNTALKFDTAGPFGVGTINTHDSNIFEVTTVAKISWGNNLFFKNNQIENFTKGFQFDNECTIAGSGCVIDNVRLENNTISVSGATGHDSPVGILATIITGKSLLAKQIDLRGNRFTIVKNGGGAAPYVVNVDFTGSDPSNFLATLSGNNFEGGTTTSIHGVGPVVVFSDQGGNNYRLTSGGSDRSNTEIYSGNARFTRWDYRQYRVFNPSLGQDTFLEIEANPGQTGLGHPVIEQLDNDGNPDWKSYERNGFAMQPDLDFEWQKFYGAQDPSDDRIYGFGAYGTAGAFSYIFAGYSRIHPFQTWYKATGNSSIGDTTTDSGHKLHVIGTGKFDGKLTQGLGGIVEGGYGPTTNLGDFTKLQYGAGGSGANAISFAWGDGSGYKINFGPVLSGTFTPKAYITDEGKIDSEGGFVAQGTPGISKVVTVKGSGGSNCDNTFILGILTASTCP